MAQGAPGEFCLRKLRRRASANSSSSCSATDNPSAGRVAALAPSVMLGVAQLAFLAAAVGGWEPIVHSPDGECTVVTLATPLTRPGLADPWPVTTHLPARPTVRDRLSASREYNTGPSATWPPSGR